MVNLKKRLAISQLERRVVGAKLADAAGSSKCPSTNATITLIADG